MTGTIVLYHDPCMDGMTAAWIVRSAIPDAELRPSRYEEPIPLDAIRGKRAIFVDISWPPEDIRRACDVAESVEIYDHHESAVRRLRASPSIFDDPPSNFYADLDMSRSGAGIAWDHFRKGEERPAWVSWVEDRDLWKFQYASTRPFAAFLRNVKKDFHDYAWLDEMMQFADSACFFLAMGEEILKLDDATLDVLAMNATIVKWPHPAGGTFPAIVSQCPSHLASDLGHRLAAQEPRVPVVALWDWNPAYLEWEDAGCPPLAGVVPPHRYKVSLRVSKHHVERGIRANLVAEEYGGGGHPGAAGFSWDKLPWEDA